MRDVLIVILLVAALVAAGCTGKSQTTAPTPTPKVVYVTVLVTPSPVPATKVTTVPTAVPTPATPAQRRITDGYWCRDTTINIGTAPTDVTECYQFFDDGTFRWGYSPGWPMGKSRSCSGDPGAKCTYSLTGDGRYEIEGGYLYTLSGDMLIDPHDPPYFTWTAKGIP